MRTDPLGRRVFAEFLGTGLLVAAVVGSGIAAAKLSPGDIGLELFENAAATVGALVALILALGPVSGAHFNPVVTLADRFFGGISTADAGAYIAAQVSGAICGSVLANAMFALPVFEAATKVRSSGPLWLAEVVATFGLLLVIFGVVRSGRASAAPFAVGAYIGGAYFFTSSTCFANPAVTIGRMFSDTFAGIKPSSAPVFIAAQIAGGALAVAAIRILYPHMAASAANVVVPHGAESSDGPTALSEEAPTMTGDYLEPGTRRRVEAELDSLRDEFKGVFSAETIERFIAESIAGLSGARIQTYLPIFVGRFARDRLRALGQSQGVIVKEVPVVLFLCIHNSGRSAAARVLLDHYADGSVEVRSAGSAPGDQLNPAVVAILTERGLDATKEFPKPLTDEVARAADVIVTMGCGDACPVYPGKCYLDWELKDPAGQPVESVRPIIDDIDRRVQALLAELVPATARKPPTHEQGETRTMDDTEVSQEEVTQEAVRRR